jgi:DNA-binding transcriptional ArsR family regulator
MAAAKRLDVVAGAERAASMLDPLRLKLLEALQSPNSASGLARAMKLPRQRINYHLRQLETHGLVEFVEERRKGNCRERVVRASAVTYVINPSALGSLGADPNRIEDKFSATYQVAVAAKAIRDLSVLQDRADAVKKKLATMTLQTRVRFANAAKQNEFAEELSEAVAQLVAKYHDEKAAGGRSFLFYVGGYPEITKSEEEARREAGEVR